MEQRENITVLDLASKWTSKKDLYSMPVCQRRRHLSPAKSRGNSKVSKGSDDGKKKFIKSKNILAIKIPQYKWLSVKSILEFAQKDIHIDKHLPSYEYSKESNREWIWNFANTIIPEINKIIDKKVEEKKQQIIMSQNLRINVQSEFMNVFKSSNFASLSKGKPYFITRLQRPSKEQKNIQKLEEEKKKLLQKLIMLGANLSNLNWS